MNFLRIFELFLHTHENNVDSDTQQNYNKTTTRETSIDLCHSQRNDNHSNKAEPGCNVTIDNNKDTTTTTNDSSVLSIDEVGVSKILHNLENVAPIKISPDDNSFMEPKENLISLNDYVNMEQYGSYTQANNNVTTTIETSIDLCHSQRNDNNSNKPELECNVTINDNEDYNTNDSSVLSIDEFGASKILHNLENFTLIKISPNDNTNKEPKENEISLNVDVRPEQDRIINDTTDVSLVVNVREDEHDTNQSNNDLTQIQVTNKAMGSNNATYNTEAHNVIDDETIKNLKEFEEALNSIDETALTGDFGTDLINLDDFIDIFDELDAVNEDLISMNGSVKSVTTNNEISICRDTEIPNPNKNKTYSNINENIDIISINSSTEDEETQTEEIKDSKSIHYISDELDSDDGYNSSDFEFISENEAHMAGFVINCGQKDYQNLSQASSEPLVSLSGQYRDYKSKKVASDPGEGPSRQNRARNEFEDRSYRNNHHIPIGDDYFGLFQGIYNPQLPMSEIHFLENKSVIASPMNSQYDGIGFDKQLALRRHQPDSSEDEFEDEAKESAKKILKMYPGENRKRRRRYL